MSAAKRFLFDTEFSRDGKVLAGADGERAFYTHSQVERIREKAYEAGRMEEFASQEAMAAEAFDRFSHDVQKLIGCLSTEASSLRLEATELALIVARKIAGTALDHYGEDRILAALETAMLNLREGPRLEVSIHPDVVEHIRPRIEALCDSMGYAGAIQLRPTDRIRIGDSTIKWIDGLIVDNRDEAVAAIEAEIVRRLNEIEEEENGA